MRVRRCEECKKTRSRAGGCGFNENTCLNCKKKFWESGGIYHCCPECARDYDLCYICGKPHRNPPKET